MRCLQIFAVAMMVATMMPGCGRSRQEAIDDAYRRGEISAAERQRRTNELRDQSLAANEQAMQQFQQQPVSNPNYDKLVWPQPTEDPHHTGRPIDEMKQ